MPRGEVRAYRLEPCPSVRDRAAPLRASSSIRSARRATSASISSSVASMPSWATTARSARSALTAAVEPSRTPATNASCSWPVAARYCGIVAPWASSRVARSCRRRSISCITSASGASIVDEAGRGLEHLVAHEHAAPAPCRTARGACAQSARSSSSVSNSLTSETHSSVASGSTLRFASFTSTWNATSSPPCSPKRSGSMSVNLRMSPGLRAAQLLVELRRRAIRSRPRRGSPSR